MRIKEIWKELENDKSFSKGLLIRRYSGSVIPEVFIAMQVPEKLFCIAASINSEINIKLSNYLNLQEIQLEVFPDINHSNKNILLFKLLNNQHKDIFAILCEDLILCIANETNEKKLVTSLLNRFEKWKSLFNKIGLQGLSIEEQHGLYGELFFLRKFLQNNADHANVLNSWVGPEKEIRDFQNGNWGVEIKTTQTNNQQKVHISSERQLDASNLVNLFLYHISIDVRQNTGETLIDIIDSIAEILNSDFPTLNRFKSKLFEAGFFDQHKDLYSNTGYFIRQDFFYKVENEFPRIEEAEIRNGVGDVKYSIVISQCTEFKRTEEYVFKSLIFL